jgi:hypothetical protein
MQGKGNGEEVVPLDRPDGGVDIGRNGMVSLRWAESMRDGLSGPGRCIERMERQARGEGVASSGFRSPFVSLPRVDR